MQILSNLVKVNKTAVIGVAVVVLAVGVVTAYCLHKNHANNSQ